MAGEKLRAAIARGARTGVVAATGFALGHWLLASTDIAGFATFTGLALTGIANFGGTIPARSLATTAAAIAGVALTALGTWASIEPLAIGVAVMFVATATVSYSSVLGGYAAAGAIAVAAAAAHRLWYPADLLRISDTGSPSDPAALAAAADRIATRTPDPPIQPTQPPDR